MSDEIRIFISYARADAEQVLPVYHRLKDEGFAPWIDQEDLLPGMKWRTAIENAMREAHFFLLFLSPRSSNRRGFIQREINTALDLWEEKMHDDIYFIPLRLEECEIPERVDEFQCVNLYEDRSWDRLLKALRRQTARLGGASASVSVPRQAPVKPPAPLAGEFEFITVTLDAEGKEIERRKGRARGAIEDLGGGVRLDLVEIPGGEFWMGSTDAEAQAAFTDNKRYFEKAEQWWYTAETPRHRVAVSSFLMGKYPVTQAQWFDVMGDLPEIEEKLRGDGHPIVNVSWEEANAFCKELTRRTKQQYRLPTEAEWEYAARGGTTTPFAFGANINPQVVNFGGVAPFGNAPKGLYREKTVPVGSLGIANGFGLYDMHGNVWEWCSDWYSKEYYAECKKQGTVIDPQGPKAGSARVDRGGGWSSLAVICRSARRDFGSPGYRGGILGFRLVRVGRIP